MSQWLSCIHCLWFLSSLPFKTHSNRAFALILPSNLLVNNHYVVKLNNQFLVFLLLDPSTKISHSWSLLPPWNTLLGYLEKTQKTILTDVAWNSFTFTGPMGFLLTLWPLLLRLLCWLLLSHQPPNAGVHQGSALSPFLFSVYPHSLGDFN